ncbi:MAG: beta-propeller fold lactonase family protein [Myxococcota bacterium]|nr:beta-propeller fold lactonase family protein [Myxococcota bacterium]
MAHPHPVRRSRRALRFQLAALVLAAAGALALTCGAPPTGHPGFASPQADPIALSPDGSELYVVNTPADVLEVIDTATLAVVQRIPTGIDPVSVAVRPDGKEVWVSNHVSDTVSVVDTDPASRSRYHVVATVTAWDESGQVTDFDEPVGIAFASDAKAYVALSSRNRIAVVDVASRAVTKQIQVWAQEPRALAVRNGRLYALPFESGNQTEFSGCINPATDPICTFSFLFLSDNSGDDILTRNMVADIVRRAEVPDRDLFVYDTADETPLFEVSTIGTLLYGLAVDSQGRVFIAQTEGRNDANGAAGTAGEELVDIENRMFLNQIARVDCSGSCDQIDVFDLEPLPPVHPTPGTQLATPFGIQISADDSTIVAVASGSSRLFTLDANTGARLGSTAVGAIPRGLVLESSSEGAPQRAWVFNAVENSVSRVDVSNPASPTESARIALDDPTHPDVKLGRIAFNDAAGSTTGTFSCASCHPDGNTDQLLWNLGSKCFTDGCDQAQPRTTMPIRGLRGTLPLHWDGVPGDPIGGINGETTGEGPGIEPNCTDEHSCFRDLVDGAMSGTMCDQTGCPDDQNEAGLAGAFSEAERDAMAVFLRSVPYPPARSRRLDDQFSELGALGWRHFVVGTDAEHPGCSRAGACHSLPFWANSNTPGSGMDAPTFRGMTDRHLLLPNGRAGMWELISATGLNEVPWDPNHGPDELYSWGMTFGTEFVPLTNRASLGTGPFSLFQLFEEGSTGFSSTVGRQVTLDPNTTAPAQLDATVALLARLEQADADGVVQLLLQGVELRWGLSDRTTYAYEDGLYWRLPNRQRGLSRQELIEGAQRGDRVVTATARLGPAVDVDHPQPALWLSSQAPQHEFARFFLARIPLLSGPVTHFTFFGHHVAPGAIVVIDGRAVEGTLSCAVGGELPSCQDDAMRVELAALPPVGEHTFQLVTPGGLMSNEVPLDVR